MWSGPQLRRIVTVVDGVGRNQRLHVHVHILYQSIVSTVTYIPVAVVAIVEPFEEDADLSKGKRLL